VQGDEKILIVVFPGPQDVQLNGGASPFREKEFRKKVSQKCAKARRQKPRPNLAVIKTKRGFGDTPCRRPRAFCQIQFRTATPGPATPKFNFVPNSGCAAQTVDKQTHKWGRRAVDRLVWGGQQFLHRWGVPSLGQEKKKKRGPPPTRGMLFPVNWGREKIHQKFGGTSPRGGHAGFCPPGPKHASGN